MRQESVKEIYEYIVTQSLKLKNKYLPDFEARIEFADIFTHKDNEYQRLTKEVSICSESVYDAGSGYIYLLNRPIHTPVGNLYYVKVRKPDSKLKLRGDADFSTKYHKLKKHCQNNPHFEHIVRDAFEMLRLSDPDFDVMACFSNIPVRKWL